MIATLALLTLAGCTRDSSTPDLGPCVTPTAGMEIAEDTTLCAGDFQLPAGEGAAIVVTAPNVTLRCPLTNLIGDKIGDGIGVRADGVTIDGCSLAQYGRGIAVEGAGGALRLDKVRMTSMVRAFVDVRAGGDGPPMSVSVRESRFHGSDGGGVSIVGADTVELRDLKITNDRASEGVLLQVVGGRKVTLADSLLHSWKETGGRGMLIADARDVEIRDNNIELSGKGHGLRLVHVSGMKFTGNRILVPPGHTALDIDPRSEKLSFSANRLFFGQVYDRSADADWCGGKLINLWRNGADYHGPQRDAVDCRSQPSDPAAPPDPCVEPTGSLDLTVDTTLCAGEFHLSGETPFAITVSSPNVRVRCEGTKLIGDGTQHAFRVLADGVTIDGCEMSNFKTGFFARDYGAALTISHVKVEGVSEAFADIQGNAERNLKGVQIVDSEFRDSKAGGVHLARAKDVVLRDLRYFNDEPTIESPIHVDHGRDIWIERAKINSHGGKGCNGVWIVDSEGVTVRDSEVEMAGSGDGSHVVNSRALRFVDNRVTVPKGNRALHLDEGCADYAVVGNDFVGGSVHDQGAGGVWCEDSTGNDYRDGAAYDGPDDARGSCPANLDTPEASPSPADADAP
ncbi:MAG: right-handed parallel beta-helix repeat-containing protein [Deltaproteobacteria bacterium]|nr:right-handed parallel beta-helix repeat-containing protein [Deltaproteobacteria bacterium]